MEHVSGVGIIVVRHKDKNLDRAGSGISGMKVNSDKTFGSRSFSDLSIWMAVEAVPGGEAVYSYVFCFQKVKNKNQGYREHAFDMAWGSACYPPQP